MIEPRCIRYFKTKESAQKACDLLIKEGFQAYIEEDKFKGVSLKDLGVAPRYRLYVEKAAIVSIARTLLRKMKK